MNVKRNGISCPILPALLYHRERQNKTLMSYRQCFQSFFFQCKQKEASIGCSSLQSKVQQTCSFISRCSTSIEISLISLQSLLSTLSLLFMSILSIL